MTPRDARRIAPGLTSGATLSRQNSNGSFSSTWCAAISASSTFNGAAPKAVESARNYFVENIEAMAPRIAKSGQYLMGDQFSVADILLMTCLEWAVIERIPLSEPLARVSAARSKPSGVPESSRKKFPTSK